MEHKEIKRINGTIAAVRLNADLVQFLRSLCAMYKNAGIKLVFLKTKTKPKPLKQKDLSLV
jgi:hypothetical protein